jgi:hypothetical protein
VWSNLAAIITIAITTVTTMNTCGMTAVTTTTIAAERKFSFPSAGGRLESSKGVWAQPPMQRAAPRNDERKVRQDALRGI